MKIYCITSQPNILDSHKKRLEALGELTVINASQLTDDEVIEKAGDADILIAGSSGIKFISPKIIDGLKNLKLIATLTVGTAWVDIDYAKKKGIPVSNIKGANAESVAEHVWGMILDLSKRITEFDRDVRNKGAYQFGPYKGKEVYGKTLGIIGTGDIGAKVARIAGGFDMKVLGFNKSGRAVAGMEIVSKEKLLKESDIISLNVPLSDETKDIVSFKEIEMMKDGVIIINCSIEGIINKEAVLKGVKSGKIFGFGIETDIMKPIPPDDEYLKYPNILVNAHNAFNTIDADIKSYELMIENIEAFLKGKPQNVVNGK